MSESPVSTRRPISGRTKLKWGLGLGAVACVVALDAPAAVVRRCALAAKVFTEGVALLVILSHA